MRLGWSPHSKGSSAPVIDYLTLGILTNRLGLKADPIVRTPAPETLRGDPAVVGAFIDALETQHTYACATLSFAPDDLDLDTWLAEDETLRDQIGCALDLWEDIAFAGVLPECRPPIFANTHTHTGRLEVNILAPRAVVRRVGDRFLPRAHNPHPPKGAQRNIWRHYQDTLNHTFGWADPQDPWRTARVSGPDWTMKRAAELERSCTDIEHSSVDPANDMQRRIAEEPAPVQIMFAARQIEREPFPDRLQLLKHLKPVLSDLNWQIDAVTEDQIILHHSTDETKRPFKLKGTLCQDKPSIPTASQMRMREEALSHAPDKLSDGYLRCAQNNHATLGSQVVSIPRPEDRDIVHRLTRPTRRTLRDILRDTFRAVRTRLHQMLWSNQINTALPQWCDDNSFADSRDTFAEIANSLASALEDKSNRPKTHTPNDTSTQDLAP